MYCLGSSYVLRVHRLVVHTTIQYGNAVLKKSLPDRDNPARDGYALLPATNTNIPLSE